MVRQLLGFVAGAVFASAAKQYTLSEKEVADAGEPLESFVSYSIELSSFPDFAGQYSPPSTRPVCLAQTNWTN